MEAPRNRKQRRAAAANMNTASEEPDIPLALPERGDPSKKSSEPTLYDIIEKRQKELLKQAESLGKAPAPALGKGLPSKPTGTRYVTVDASGNLVEADGNVESPIPMNMGTQKAKPGRKAQPKDNNDDPELEIDKPLPPLLDTILLAIPLTTLHLTLAYLAAHQYAESTNIPVLIKESIFITLPLLTFLVHFVHGHIVSFKLHTSFGFLAARPVSVLPLTRDKFTFFFLRRLVFPPTLRTIILLPISMLLGAHLITITNGEPYYAVMKKAPAFGTMWIWCILEMSFGPAVLGALGPLIWGVYYMGYGIF
ncbi:uncharacterized protein N7496_006854 [Penicillium cataractarum]|uniref:DUF7719 domain-containing protein n=1 Tax=Penicillium cataractarum TaxID=2100454 RepID=A0A9W9S2A5_9EURO|nr:uncharacterized protein N7496_006854 [Penicillium cataractarum]KAJ5370762.1 hypothetical protein N7496_006854 [Penicillium cataractarum]